MATPRILTDVTKTQFAPLLDVSGMAIGELHALADNPILKRSIGRLVDSMTEPDGVISAFGSFISDFSSFIGDS